MYPNLALPSSFAESANYVVVVDLVAAAAATLVFAVACVFRAAASAEAAVARHACCVCFFFSIHKADVSSTGIDHHASGRSPQTSRIYSVDHVATHVSTEQE